MNRHQPEGYIDFEVYEDGSNFLGIAKIQLPDIKFLTQTITGAGIAGNVEAVLTGMVDAMNLTLNFSSAMDAAVSLMKPETHLLDMRVAEQYWDVANGKKHVAADKYVVVVMPKTLSPGTVAPASAADVSGEYSVYSYAAYKDGKNLWDIAPRESRCVIDGVDYMAAINAALGR